VIYAIDPAERAVARALWAHRRVNARDNLRGVPLRPEIRIAGFRSEGVPINPIVNRIILCAELIYLINHRNTTDPRRHQRSASLIFPGHCSLKMSRGFIARRSSRKLKDSPVKGSRYSSTSIIQTKAALACARAFSSLPRRCLLFTGRALGR